MSELHKSYFANFKKEWANNMANGVTAIRARKDKELSEQSRREEQERQERMDRTPLSPTKWINNEYFAGSLARGLYPKLKDVFSKIFEYDVHTILLAGATRWGKTTLALAVQGYSQYLVSCMANPQRTFNVLDESIILYLNTNTTDLKARAAYFTKYSAWIKATPFFMKEYAPRSNVITSLIFPKNVVARFSGAHVNAAESEDLIFYIGDEANLYDVIEKSKRAIIGSKYDAAEQIDSSIQNRMGGTFMKRDGSFPPACKVVWLCKETYPESFMRRKIKEVSQKSEVEQKKFMIVESSEWGMKPKGTYEDKYFWVKTATRTQSACIIEDEEKVERLKKKSEELKNADTTPEDEQFIIMAVPTVHRLSAEKNIEEFQRNMMGIPTEAISRFIKQRQIVFNAIREPNKKLAVKINFPGPVCCHPFNVLSTNTKDNFRVIKERVSERVQMSEDEVVWRPIINPNMERFIHIDAGLTGDAAGWAMGHCAGWVNVVRQIDDDLVQEVAPFVWIDAMLRVEPPSGEQIPFSFLRALVYWFEKLGFIIGKVTCDSFQHVSITQPLMEKGYDVEIVSIDRTTDPYDELLLALVEKRISTYEYRPFEEEAVNLERIAKGNRDGKKIEKIDHPVNGKKDIADAVAGVTFQIKMNAKDAALTPVVIQNDNVETLKKTARKGKTAYDMFEAGDFEGMMKIEDIDTLFNNF